MICPFVADQPSWAKLAHGLGVGPAPLPFDELTARRLADALIEAVTKPQIAQRAQDVRRRVEAEDGMGQAADLIHLALGA